MKTAIYLFSTLLIILASVIIMRKNSDKEVITTEAIVMRDITDHQIAEPKLEDITSLYDLKNSKWHGASFRFVDITDVSYNHTYETKINPENEWMGNEFEREKKVNKFYAEITQILSNAETETSGKDNSSIYIPIARELNRLSQSTYQDKIMLVYSDLMENTDDFSLYKKSNLNLLKTNPDTVRKYFEGLNLLKNLKGIKIFLVYQPVNKESDEQYRLIAGFYKDLLESKGATVEITANIN